MTEPSEAVTITYPSYAAMARAMRDIRKYGFAAPFDHVLVELARLVLILAPLLAFLTGYISVAVLVAFLVGYFAHRGFMAFLKPAMLRAAGPVFGHAMASAQHIAIRMDDSGVWVDAGLTRTFFDWRVMPPVERRSRGLVLRLASEKSLPIVPSALPAGMSLDSLSNQITQWHEAAK